MSKISLLLLKNCIGVKELELRPKNVNIISGGNGQGKTSVVDSLKRLFLNEDSREEFVTAGAEKAKIHGELDDNTIIDKTIEGNKTTGVKVVHDDMIPKSPETFLKSLLGKYPLGIDPTKFMLAGDKEQVEMLVSLFDIRVTKDDLLEWLGEMPPVDLTQNGLQVCKDLANDRGGYYYDKRKFVNGEVSNLKSQIETIMKQLPDDYDPEKWRNVVLGELHKKVQDGITVNANRRTCQFAINNEEADIQEINNRAEIKLKRTLASTNQEIDDTKELIGEYEKKIAALKSKLETLEDSVKTIEKEVYAARDQEIEQLKKANIENQKYLDENRAVDITALKKEAADAEEMKGYVSQADKKISLEAQLKEKQVLAEKYDRFVEIMRKKPAELLKKCNIPVPGLSIDDDMKIRINGLPIKNLSTGEQLKLAIEITKQAIIRSGSKLRFILVDKFETLDPSVQEEVYRHAEEDSQGPDGFQYFFFKVTSALDEKKLRKEMPEIWDKYHVDNSLKVETF